MATLNCDQIIATWRLKNVRRHLNATNVMFHSAICYTKQLRRSESHTIIGNYSHAKEDEKQKISRAIHIDIMAVPRFVDYSFSFGRTVYKKDSNFA